MLLGRLCSGLLFILYVLFRRSSTAASGSAILRGGCRLLNFGAADFSAGYEYGLNGPLGLRVLRTGLSNLLFVSSFGARSIFAISRHLNVLLSLYAEEEDNNGRTLFRRHARGGYTNF